MFHSYVNKSNNESDDESESDQSKMSIEDSFQEAGQLYNRPSYSQIRITEVESDEDNSNVIRSTTLTSDSSSHIDSSSKRSRSDDYCENTTTTPNSVVENNIESTKKRALKTQESHTIEELVKSNKISKKKKELYESKFSQTAANHQQKQPHPNVNKILNLRSKQQELTMDAATKFISFSTIKKIVETKCCDGLCLGRNLSENNGKNSTRCFDFVEAVRKDFIHKSYSERKEILLKHLCASKDGVTSSGRQRFNFSLSSKSFEDGKCYSFCANSFSNITGCSNRYRSKLCKELDPIRTEINDKGYNSDCDESNYENVHQNNPVFTVSTDLFKEIKTNLKDNNIVVNDKILSYFILPQGHKSSKARAWMQQFFNLVGDQVPNNYDTIHIDCMPKKAVWEEYRSNMKLFYGQKESYINYNNFMVLWRTCFPHVKVRRWKNVTGHCKTCERLATLRRTIGDNHRRGLLTLLHAYHRQLYMGEKDSYYERQMLALLNPNDYMSIITDGMNQQHSILPHLGNKNEFGDKALVQHLQLIIEHGQSHTIYRTFGQIKNDRNAAIHSFLLQLETRIENFGFLPPTIFIQVDGGAENANETFLAVCCLLVARRLGLCQKIVLTRLPVGHTHEDGDAIFGVLWKASRENSILTPQQYKEMIQELLLKENEHIKVTDIFVTPDYEKIMEGCIDPELTHLWKSEQTKLQWIMEAVEPCPRYPLGVKTTYRAFVQSENFEIIEVDRKTMNPAHSLDYTVRYSSHETFPPDHKPPVNVLFLPALGVIFPKGLVKNCAAKLDGTLRKVAEYFSSQDAIIAEWQRFRELMPDDDYVTNYIEKHAVWHVPLYEELFCELDVNTISKIEPVQRKSRKDPNDKSYNRALDKKFFDNLPIQKARSTESVIHSGNYLSAIPPLREVLYDPTSAKTPAELTEMFYGYIRDLKADKSITNKKLISLLHAADPRISKGGNKEELLNRLKVYYANEYKLINSNNKVKSEIVNTKEEEVQEKSTDNSGLDPVDETIVLESLIEKLTNLKDNNKFEKRLLLRLNDEVPASRRLAISESKYNRTNKDKLVELLINFYS